MRSSLRLQLVFLWLFSLGLPASASTYGSKVFEGLVDDQEIILSGTWTDGQQDKLREAIVIALATRRARPVGPLDSTMINSMSFEFGPKFAVDVREIYIPNMSIWWGVGISGYRRRIYSIPEFASSGQIASFLWGRLPDFTYRPGELPRKLDASKWPKWCESLLGVLHRN